MDIYKEKHRLDFSRYDKQKQPLANKECSLQSKIKLVAEDLVTRRVKTKSEVKSALTTADSNGLLSVETLHAYVHNSDFVPSADELRLTWDRLETFLQAVWQ